MCMYEIERELRFTHTHTHTHTRREFVDGESSSLLVKGTIEKLVTTTKLSLPSVNSNKLLKYLSGSALC